MPTAPRSSRLRRSAGRNPLSNPVRRLRQGPAAISPSSALPKLFAVCCIAAVAAFAALTVVRFADIAHVQAEINNLNSRIEATERSINDLDFSSQPNINAVEFAKTVGLVPAQH